MPSPALNRTVLPVDPPTKVAVPPVTTMPGPMLPREITDDAFVPTKLPSTTLPTPPLTEIPNFWFLTTTLPPSTRLLPDADTEMPPAVLPRTRLPRT